MHIDDYNIEAFKALRQEIQLRLDKHYNLILTKYAGAGAIFSFLITNADSRFSPFIISAIFSYVFDIIILENLGHIRFVGAYISNVIEKTIPSNLLLRWETDAAQRGGKWECVSPLGYTLGVSITGHALLLGFWGYEFEFANFISPNMKFESFVLLACFYLSAYVTFLTWYNLKREITFCSTSASPVRTESYPEE